jgi:hypothetical protein
MASVRYRIGLSGRWDGGGAPGIRGRAGLIVGIGEVRRCWRIRDMFYVDSFSIHLLGRLGYLRPYPLSNALLAMSHEQVRDLIHYHIIPSLVV